MQGLLQDFRYAARLLLQKPAFTVIVAITLALGIGASTAIFSIIDAVLLRPLPFPDPARLVVVWENSLSGREDRSYVSPSNFQDWRDQSRSFQSLAAVQNLPVNFAGFAGEPEELPAQQVS